ncbi:MAG: DegT/DnrJ/EryC1/StrS family aminotransferase [Candidatus Spechtbacterales bacterium]|nr:DegT/DnrJ/EryC1/StrS family aminotransferase [Candidatus Spechtbacterales bacterium]
MQVPFLDLKTQHKDIEEDIKKEFSDILENTAFVSGKRVENFESELSDYCGSNYAVACNSGTSALHLALMGHGIGDKDEVITQPNTFFATAEAISHAGATPVFADIDPQALTLDPKKVEDAITEKTRAIIVVHIYGIASPMDELREIADKNNLVLIEDAAQAHGAEYRGKRLSSLGGTTCFSFYPSKVIGAAGEGGAIVTNNREIYERMLALRDHGQTAKHEHTYVGYNYRMTELQGAVLAIKLKKLDNWLASRRNNAALYSRLLAGLEPRLTTHPSPEYSNCAYYLYVVSARDRDNLKKYLNENGIGAAVHYPTPVHLQPAYKELGYNRGDMPCAEKHAEEILSLPMYPELKEEQIKYVCDKIKEFYS